VNATSVAPVACGDSLCLVYHAPFPNTNGESGSNFLQQKIDGTGAGVGNIGILSYDSAHNYGWAIPLPLGRDIVTVLGGSTDDDLGVVRLSASLSPDLPVTLDTTITRWPRQAHYVPAIAARGPDLLVAWGPAPKDRIRIARITFPPPR
jgi:hypothetical protein